MSIADNLKKVRAEVELAVEKAGRQQGSVQIIAVSKTWPSEKIREAYEAGQRVFGENYTQEALGKMQELSDLDIQWHFIGGLQSKKVKSIDGKFDLIHSVDRVSLVDEFDRRLNKVQDVLLQVNFEAEDSKSGVSPEEAGLLIQRISQSEKLCLKGLMVMPPMESSDFKKIQVFQKVQRFLEGKDLLELSMGTTHDYNLAIEYGSTMIRVGTAIFGERS